MNGLLIDPMAARFAGKVVLVTGGASGIGLAAARAFAAEGASVVLADRDAAGAEAGAAAIRAGGGTALGVAADVADFDACTAMVARAVEAFGGLHIAFNNAGIPSVIGGDFEDVAPAEWERLIATNLGGVFYSMKAEVPAMRAAGGTAIVNTASVASLVAAPGMAAYVASKHGVAGLTKAASLDLIRHGIRVNAICPGFVDTPMLAGAMASPEARAGIAAAVPIGRVADAEEVARTVLFLASDEASYMVGALLSVDGGVTVQ
ncbi:MAG TPA: SDR family NAD(P)-dependent oxidoreductase [Sphingomonas sp.]|nr:SDR family NAD(P)-dependent oxidoreductase [Sphingomonas sp.]